jgi:hypothetical protein
MPNQIINQDLKQDSILVNDNTNQSDILFLKNNLEKNKNRFESVKFKFDSDSLANAIYSYNEDIWKNMDLFTDVWLTFFLEINIEKAANFIIDYLKKNINHDDKYRQQNFTLNNEEEQVFYKFTTYRRTYKNVGEFLRCIIEKSSFENFEFFFCYFNEYNFFGTFNSDAPKYNLLHSLIYSLIYKKEQISEYIIKICPTELLNKRFDARGKFYDCSTAIELIIKNNNIRLLKLVLSIHNFKKNNFVKKVHYIYLDPNYKSMKNIDDDGKYYECHDYEVNYTVSYLDIAVRHNLYEIAELLLKNGFNPDTYSSRDDSEYTTALDSAIGKNNIKFVKLLLKYGAKSFDWFNIRSKKVNQNIINLLYAKNKEKPKKPIKQSNIKYIFIDFLNLLLKYGAKSFSFINIGHKKISVRNTKGPRIPRRPMKTNEDEDEDE